MQQHHSYGYGPHIIRSQQQRPTENPNQGNIRNEGAGSRPEIENPQPARKVEEPITANDQGITTDKDGKQQKEDQTNTPDNSDAGIAENSNKDYQRSEAGFQPDKDK